MHCDCGAAEKPERDKGLQHDRTTILTGACEAFLRTITPIRDREVRGKFETSSASPSSFAVSVSVPTSVPTPSFYCVTLPNLECEISADFLSQPALHDLPEPTEDVLKTCF